MPFISVQHAATLLHHGEVVAFPTETVYGLGADANNPDAIAKIFQIKGRPSNHPVIVHLADKDDVQTWAASIPAQAWALLEQFSPGPLTLILKKKAQVLPAITGGQDTVGIRIPSHPVAQALLQHFGNGIAAPSANRFGHISPTHAHHVEAEFRNKVSIVDGGSSAIGLESTIVDVSSLDTGGQARLLRPGHIAIDALREILGDISYNDPQKHVNVPRASGMLERHYAPRTPCFLIDNFNVVQADDAVLSYQALPANIATKINHEAWLQLPDNPQGYAQKLYASLRQLDALEPARILVENVPRDELWLAIRDRLKRASEGLLS